MLNIPENIKELLKADSTRKYFRVHFPNGERADITNANIVEESVAYTEKVSTQGFKFGLSGTPYIEFETIGIENIKGKTIECFLDVDTGDGLFSIPYGVFDVTSSRINNLELEQRKIVAYANDLTQFPLGKAEEAKEKYPASTNTPYTVNIQKTVLSMFNFEKQEGTYTDLPFVGDALQNFLMYGENTYIGSVQYGLRCLAYELNNVSKAQMLYWTEFEETTANIDEIASELGLPTDTREEMRNLMNPFIAMRSNLSSGGLIRYSRPYVIPSTSNYIYPFLNLSSAENTEVYGGSSQSSYICIPIEAYSIVRAGGIDNMRTVPIRSTTNAKIQSVALTYELGLNTSINRSKYTYTLPFAPSGGTATVDCYLVADNDKLNAYDIISGYFELAGALVKTTKDGKIGILPLGKDTVEYDNTIIKDVWIDDAMTKPYGRIYAEYTNTNGKTANFYHYLIPQSDWNPERYQTYSITNNAIIKNNTFTSATLHNAVQILAEALADVSYMPMDIKVVGLPYVEAGDKVIIRTSYGVFESYVLDRTLSGIDVLTDSIVAEADENDVDYTSAQTKGEASSEVEEQITALQNGKMDINGVVATQNVTTGTLIGSVTINGLETKLYAPGGSGGGGGATLLWQNTAPSSSFAAQFVQLSDDVANYDFIGIVCAAGSNSADNRSRFLPIIMVPTNSAMGGTISLSSYRNYRRDFSMGNNTVTFENGTYYATYGTNTTTNSNTSLVPRYILGFNYGGIISASATSEEEL